MKNEQQARVAIVTGAAGGIGSATVTRLLSEKYCVVAVDRDAKGLELVFAKKDGVISLAQDITSPSASSSIVAFAMAHYGRIDALVNNAGIGAAKSVDEELETFLDINIKGAFRLSREVLSVFSPGACIVNVSSTFGLVGFPDSSSYAVTKSALLGLTRQMAVDYGPRGIRVNAVAPGLISSPLTRERISSNHLYRDLLVRGTPFPRIGETTDIANAINFLCSDEASFINGHILTVDGGWSATRYLSAT